MAPVKDITQDDRLRARLIAFDARDPVMLCQTDFARVFKVTLADGASGVLKLYHGADMAGEENGVTVLRAAGGVAAVDILETCKDAILMQHLEGSSLGDFTRAGEDDRATDLLVGAVQTLHGALPESLPKLTTLERRFQGLFTLQYGPRCPEPLKRNMHRAADLARTLLENPLGYQILHGDVHHDNAILTPMGVKFIDAKGLVGDPGFEMANSFRNPHGSDAIFCNPDRAKALTKKITARLGIDPTRQLSWAAAKCALSIAWNAEPVLNRDDPEHDILSMLLDLSIAGAC